MWRLKRISDGSTSDHATVRDAQVAAQKKVPMIVLEWTSDAGRREFDGRRITGGPVLFTIQRVR